MTATVPAGALAGAMEPKINASGKSRVRRYIPTMTTKKAPKDSAKMMEMTPVPSRLSEVRFSSEPMLKATKPKAISVMKDSRSIEGSSKRRRTDGPRMMPTII